ncbi:hypothetical protein CQW23_33561 [Capsicum baccatum]|uniref:Uncharacterized protein n=1 Tax=Capsicum baccatum TaxID=33114 RepID=A0A2G2V1E0_CAPBA|nr:hypothetical protein CQW23_33561 [Capsicum baccatum]
MPPRTDVVLGASLSTYAALQNAEILHSELAVRRAGKAPERTVPSPSPGRHAARGAARAVNRQPTGSGLGPPCPALRANPFPKLTNPFCQFPLPTLFHRPEVVHLGDLARAVHRQPTGSGLGPPCPALRANPFPEVTDPFCRLPLPTLFHRPEAVHLGDLMRL